MRITSNRDVNTQQGIKYTQDIQDKGVKKDNPASGVAVSLSSKQERIAVLSDEELQSALENVLSSKSDIQNVQQADEMIARANKRILENANESILAQANQTPPMVAELTQ